jgi:hypothetical protein
LNSSSHKLLPQLELKISAVVHQRAASMIRTENKWSSSSHKLLPQLELKISAVVHQRAASRTENKWSSSSQGFLPQELKMSKEVSLPLSKFHIFSVLFLTNTCNKYLTN